MIPNGPIAIALLVAVCVFWPLALTGAKGRGAEWSGIIALSVWTITSVFLAVRALL